MGPLWIGLVCPAHPTDTQLRSGEFGGQVNTSNMLLCYSKPFHFNFKWHRGGTVVQPLAAAGTQSTCRANWAANWVVSHCWPLKDIAVHLILVCFCLSEYIFPLLLTLTQHLSPGSRHVGPPYFSPHVNSDDSQQTIYNLQPARNVFYEMCFIKEEARGLTQPGSFAYFFGPNLRVQSGLSGRPDPLRTLHQGTLFPWKGVHGLQQCLGRWWYVSTWIARPKVSKQNIAQIITLPLPACPPHIVHPGVMCSPGKWRTSTRLPTWCKRKRDWGDQATFFHCSVVQFWCSCAHCWCFWRWTGVSMDTLTGVRLCSSIHNKLWYTVSSDTFVSEPTLTSSAIWATVAHLLDQTMLASHSQRAWVSLGRLWPCGGSPLFLPFTSFDRYWPLQTRTSH